MKIELKSYDVISLYVIGGTIILLSIMSDYQPMPLFAAGIFAVIGKGAQDKKAKYVFMGIAIVLLTIALIKYVIERCS